MEERLESLMHLALHLQAARECEILEVLSSIWVEL